MKNTAHLFVRLFLKYPTEGRHTLLLVIIMPLVWVNLSAQNLTVNTTYTGQQLLDALVDNSCAQVSNVMVSGWSGSAGGNSYGYFTGGGSFPFSNGIILSTGFAASAHGPNNTILSEGNDTWGGDTDLQNALNMASTLNATVLEFDFVPYTNFISFEYIFASEEYTDFEGEGCNFSDGFAFLLKRIGTSNYRNLAVIPDTNIPVKVTTVRGTGSTCPPVNANYFGAFNGPGYVTNFNGQTKILTAKSAVVPGELYHIKLVIADQGDTQYDAAIFLRANSFSGSMNLGTDRLRSADNALCPGTTLLLDAALPTAQGYQWFKNGVAIAGETNAAYTVSAEGQYSVQIEVGTTCSIEGDINIQYTAAPVPVPPSVVPLCVGRSVVLNPGTFSSYTWNTTPVQNTPTITVTDLGTYTVTVTGASGCPETRTFNVIASEPPTVSGVDIAINDFMGGQNSITVTIPGITKYEYSLDGINYTPNTTFGSLTAGQYTLYVRDLEGCHPPFAKTFFVMDYPTFFTPNGDGTNDYWHIPFLQFQPGAEITIYDRYGKIIKRINAGSTGWDGTYNGTHLPSTDYWFVLNLVNGRIIKGHFAMLR